MTSWHRELDVAVDAATRAGELALKYQHGIEAESKYDLSPVTKADREAEQLIASMLSGAFPGDGLLGEEGSNRETATKRRWIIDPIDGTRDYVRGNPFWSTLIGLEVDGEVVAGVASFPGLKQVYTGSKGGGAFLNGQPIRVSNKTALTDAVICVNGFNKLDGVAYRPRLLDWLSQFWAVRSYGGSPDAMMVASGQADVWLEPIAAPWDLAPLKIILEEAGAAYFTLAGPSTIYGGNCIACTPALAGAVKEFFGIREN